MTEKTEIQDVLSEIQDVVHFFDTRGDCRIAVSQVGSCLRALGLSPTQQQIATLTQQWTDEEARLAVEELAPMYRNLKKEHGKDATVDELTDCLSNFDREANGLVLVHDLRFILANCGEKMSDVEVDQLLVGQENDEGKVNIHEFIRLITSN